jgi:uncharacterized membrane protein
MRAAVAIGLLCFLIGAPAVAAAQSTGGSFGGGSFGGSSSGSSGSSSSSGGFSSGGSSSGSGGWSSGGSGSSSGWDSSSSSSGSYGGGGWEELPTSVLVVVAVILLGVFLVPVILHSRDGAPPTLVGTDLDPARDMHASALMLGIDWHARKELQLTLARLAKSGDTATAEGRARLLAETVLALRRAELSWLYVGYKQAGWVTASDAEAAFKRAGADARARFTRELVRNAGGEVATTAAPEMTARPTEGPGVVVVTLVVVSRVGVRDVAEAVHAGRIRAALGDRGALTADQLVALEVVWSPAADDDRMSTAELEQHYPELRKIDPATIAGRVFCEYCSGAFAMELLTCPHCGAAVKTPAG